MLALVSKIKNALRAYPMLFLCAKRFYNLAVTCMRYVRAKAYAAYVVMFFLTHPKLLGAYTLNGRITYRFRIFDNRSGGAKRITKEVYERVLREIEDGTFQYYGDTLGYLQEALASFPVKGKTVLVCGLESCNCDMISVYHKASKVYVCDYNPLQHDHPQVYSYFVDDFKKTGILVDAVISISSFEHDGLGRYGDPLSPDADLLAMKNAGSYLKDDGVMFFAVPVGPDCIVINAHRVYGKQRLPMMLDGWDVVSAFGYDESLCNGPATGFARAQPVFVLRKSNSNGALACE